MTTTLTTGSLTCLPRFATPRDFSRATYGHEVAAVAVRLGKPLMPWQRLVADVANEVDPETGELFYDEIVVTVPRQSGKTTLIQATTTHRATVMARRLGERQVMAYTAQTGQAAKKKLEREFAVGLRASSAFREIRNVKNRPARDNEWMLRMNSGDEHILFGSKWSSLACQPPTPKAGHGDVLDLGFIDEAFARADDAVEQAMQPAMVTRRSAQLWVVSTAGDDLGLITSHYLWDKVEAGRARCLSGDHGKVAYFEWSAEDDDDPADPETWRRCSPALGFTITERALRSRYQRAKDSPDPESMRSFCRGYMNRWPRIPRRPGESKFHMSAGQWQSMHDAESAPLDPVVVVLDASPGLESAALGVAGWRADGLRHVEVVDHRPGSEWVVARTVTVCESAGVNQVHIPPGSPALSFAKDLEAKGLEVVKPSSAVYGAACGEFVAAVRGGLVRHRSGVFDRVLADAVGSAVRRESADVFTWSRSSSAVDICPLVAVTLAFHLVPQRVEADRPVFAY